MARGSGGALGDMPSGVAWGLFRWPSCGKSRRYSGGSSGEHHWRLLRGYAWEVIPGTVHGANWGRSDPRTESLDHEMILLVIRLVSLVISIFS